MAIGSKSDVSQEFLTAISARMIKDFSRDYFIASLLQNQVRITGTQITNGVEKVTINIMPTYTAVERTELSPVTLQFNTGGSITVPISHRSVTPIGVSAQAEENSIFGSREGTGERDLRGLLQTHAVPARDAILTKLVTDAPEDIATDTDLLGANQFGSSSDANNNLTFDKAFFADLNQRLKESDAPVGNRKVLLVSPADFTNLQTTTSLFDVNVNNEKATFVDQDTIYLPAYQWFVRQTNHLYTDSGSGKLQRIAMTDNSAVIAPSSMASIINKTTARTTEGPLRFRLDLEGNAQEEYNAMYLSTNYGVKVYQPKNVFIIEDN